MTEPTSTRKPSELANEWVLAAYKQLEAHTGILARQAQRRLSRLTAAALLANKPLATEAPTGTGKTLAYLVGALGAQQVSGVPIVVSTATKALQQQLLSADLPRLFKVGLLDPKVVALAKGRSNYLCLREADFVAHSMGQASLEGDAFFDERLLALEPEEVRPLVDAFASGAWNGDFDMYEGTRPRSVIPIAANADTCTRKKCEHYKVCAFFKARKELETARVVVANHDLVLADLSLAADTPEGGSFPVANYYAIFDEAHHLPDKAIAVGSAESNLVSLNAHLPKLTGASKLLDGFAMVKEAVQRNAAVTPDHLDPSELRARLRPVLSALNDLELREDSSVLRFPQAKLDPSLASVLPAALEEAEQLNERLDRASSFLRDGLTKAVPGLPSDNATQTRLTELTRRILEVKRYLDQFVKLGVLLRSGNRLAVWMYRDNKAITLHAAPLEGADVLRPLLWASERVKGTVMVSATLRDLGGFERFIRRAGLPAEAYCEAMPYTFDYSKSQLVVADMAATPKPAERMKYLAELRVKLPQVVHPKEGTLLLFPSWSMLKEFTPLLRQHFGDKVRVQAEQPVRLLVKDHCAAIDRGEGAILAGVATLAEGLDLPGAYCTHVVIMALPFAVPADPVEEELAELLGNQYFAKRSLPDAMVRLTQMVGRLLRRESDIGRVTIFDRRLAATSYGKNMLRALPPFNKVIEKAPAL